MIEAVVPGTKRLSIAGRSIAAPSWVIGDSLAANCRFLAGKVQEVGLLFFETDSCLAYTEQDLPLDLAELALSWHVHLPLDLPWDAPHAAAAACLALMDKVAYLGVRRAVLHPPQPGRTFSGGAVQSMAALSVFAQHWCDAGYALHDCLLENVHGADLVDIWPLVQDLDYSVCLDTGHVLAYGQYRLLEIRDLGSKVRMVHVNAPGPGGKHLSLTALAPSDCETVGRMVRMADAQAVMMLELFDWAGIVESVPLVEKMLRCRVGSI